MQLPFHFSVVPTRSQARSYIGPLMMQHHDVPRTVMDKAGTGPNHPQGLNGVADLGSTGLVKSVPVL